MLRNAVLIRSILVEPEALCQALGKGLLRLDQSAGGLGILVVGVEAGGSFLVLGIFHGGLESGLIEGDHFLAHTGGSHDGTGGAQPLVVVSQLAKSRNVGDAGIALFGEDAEDAVVGLHAHDVAQLDNAEVSLLVAQRQQLVRSAALGNVDVVEAGGVGEGLGYEPPAPEVQLRTVGDVSLFLFLWAFASGCTALTGVEAVSNGVPSFKEPSAKNAKIVLILMALVVGSTFIGVAVLMNLYHIVPQEGVTAIASLAGGIFGHGSAPFFIFQIATVIILSLATNTAFAGMPLLLAMVAQDGYMPRQFAQRGTRLNFSNGVLLIFFASSILIFLFKADVHSLLPLYATGVFVSFTISQAGMLRHWTRRKGEGWKHKAAINGVGTAICGAVCLLIAGTRFVDGAWLVVIVIPLLVLLMKRINKHYDKVATSLRVTEDPESLLRRTAAAPKVLMPVQSLNRSFLKSLNYVLSLGIKDIEFYYVSSGDGREEQLRQQLDALHIPGARFVSEVTLLRNTNEVLLRHVDELEKQMPKGGTLTVVLSQFTCSEPWANALHNQTSLQLKLQLNQRRNVTCISIPYIS